MKQFSLLLAVVVIIAAMGISGCVVRDRFYRGEPWHYRR
jgi:hypothetical protein